MHSKQQHNCENFIPILTSDAEQVCSKCGTVLEENVAEMQYLTGTQPHASSSIQICDENRFGSDNISPDGFTGEKTKKLNTTNRLILSARPKPLRMLFTNTCTAIGLGAGHTRTALYYYDILHDIRSKLKQNASQTDTFSKIVSALQKSKTAALTEPGIAKAMAQSKHWNTASQAKKWIKETIGDDEDYDSLENIISKIKKPKKLSTLNIAFFSIYQVVCDNNIRLAGDQIAVAITQHMKFARKVRMTSALTVCKTALNLEKKKRMETPILQHDILLESATLPSEKIKRTFYHLTPIITSRKDAQKLKEELETIS